MCFRGQNFLVFARRCFGYVLRWQVFGDVVYCKTTNDLRSSPPVASQNRFNNSRDATHRRSETRRLYFPATRSIAASCFACGLFTRLASRLQLLFLATQKVKPALRNCCYSPSRKGLTQSRRDRRVFWRGAFLLKDFSKGLFSLLSLREAFCFLPCVQMACFAPLHAPCGLRPFRSSHIVRHLPPPSISPRRPCPAPAKPLQSP